MSRCCNDYTGKCDQSHGCPVRETMLHTKDGGETVDTHDSFFDVTDSLPGLLRWLILIFVFAVTLAVSAGYFWK